MRERDALRVIEEKCCASKPLTHVNVEGVTVDAYDENTGTAYLVTSRGTLECKLGRAVRLVGKVPKVVLAVTEGEVPEDVVETAKRVGVGVAKVEEDGLKSVVEPEEHDVEPSVEPLKVSDEVLEVLKTIADERRATILRLLEQGDECLCNIADALGDSEPAVSYHLQRLREVGLVRRRPEGKRVYYGLTRKGRAVVELLHRLRETIEG